MPTYRSLTLSLTSQFDMLTIPEYPPPSVPPDPFTEVPPLVDESNASINVYIPTYPSSQFWISYKIAAPHPTGMLYYFKLFINGKCVVSWGCGGLDGYKGHTMFGIFLTPCGRAVEKRVLAYGSTSSEDRTPNMLEDFMEVKVYRSNGRKRVMPELKQYGEPNMSKAPRQAKKMEPSGSKNVAPNHRDGIELVNAGFMRIENPQRYYKYQLLDPLDEPFSTFRYYYRTWDQLQELGVVSSSTLATDPSFIHTTDVAVSFCRSHETTCSPKELANTTKSLIQSHENFTESEQHNDNSPSLDFDITAKLLMPEESIVNTSTTVVPHKYRPASPRLKSSHDHDRDTSIPTATMALPTNTDQDSPSPESPASSKAFPTSATSSQRRNPSITHKTSKENFASLIRTQMPPPNPDTFQLIDLSSTIEKTSSRRSSSPIPWRLRRHHSKKGLNALRNVFSLDNVKNRQHRTADVNINAKRESEKSLYSVDNTGIQVDDSSSRLIDTVPAFVEDDTTSDVDISEPAALE